MFRKLEYRFLERCLKDPTFREMYHLTVDEVLVRLNLMTYEDFFNESGRVNSNSESSHMDV